MKKFDANKFFQALKRDLWVILLDVVAVNASYYLALLIRFYVNSEFRPTVSYLLGDWASFAPWYTVICIACSCSGDCMVVCVDMRASTI